VERETLGVDGRIVLQWIFKKCDGSVDCIDLTRDRDGWRVLVNAVINLVFHDSLLRKDSAARSWLVGWLVS